MFATEVVPPRDGVCCRSKMQLLLIGVVLTGVSRMFPRHDHCTRSLLKTQKPQNVEARRSERYTCKRVPHRIDSARSIITNTRRLPLRASASIWKAGTSSGVLRKEELDQFVHFRSPVTTPTEKRLIANIKENVPRFTVRR